jgi:hypothetical protein
MPSNLAPYQYRPGQSGNVGGIGVNKIRLAVQIRKISKNGREMVDFLFAVMRGEPLPLPGKHGRNGPGRPPRPSPELRVKAAEMLLDRAFGRSKEIIELTGERSPDELRKQRIELLRQLTDQERGQLRDLLHRALARAEAAKAAATAERVPLPPDRPPDAAR